MADDTKSLPLLGGNDALAGGGGGVHSRHPAAQLKYYTDWEKGQETQARLYVSLTGQSKKHFLERFRGSSSYPYIEAIVSDNGYIDFLLQSVNEPRQEKSQVLTVLGDDTVAYFFGQNTPTFSYSGMLYTTQQDEWWEAFTLLYSELLRGTRLAQHGVVAHLRYDTRVVSGALLDFAASMSADQQMAVQFQFSMVVTGFTLVQGRKSTGTRLAPTRPTGEFRDGFDMSQYETALNVNRVGSNQVKSQLVEVVRVPAKDTTEQPRDRVTQEQKDAAVAAALYADPQVAGSTSTDSLINPAAGTLKAH